MKTTKYAILGWSKQIHIKNLVVWSSKAQT